MQAMGIASTKSSSSCRRSIGIESILIERVSLEYRLQAARHWEAETA
jgi:hypothetical protein